MFTDRRGCFEIHETNVGHDGVPTTVGVNISEHCGIFYTCLIVSTDLCESTTIGVDVFNQIATSPKALLHKNTRTIRSNTKSKSCTEYYFYSGAHDLPSMNGFA